MTESLMKCTKNKAVISCAYTETWALGSPLPIPSVPWVLQGVQSGTADLTSHFKKDMENLRMGPEVGNKNDQGFANKATRS